jgi:hypothetical protein
MDQNNHIMKTEIQESAELPVYSLLDIINKLPRASTHPQETVKYSFQTNVDDAKPFDSEIDRQYDVTEIIFKKEEAMGEDVWVFHAVTRTRHTIHLKDCIHD